MTPLYTHLACNPATDDELFVVREGEPNIGSGAHNRYTICNYDAAENPLYEDGDASDLVILFQNGPVGPEGTKRNGVTIEALLAVCADRLMGFQNGPQACEQNARALAGIESALWALHERTRDRKRRGVLGNPAKS